MGHRWPGGPLRRAVPPGSDLRQQSAVVHGVPASAPMNAATRRCLLNFTHQQSRPNHAFAAAPTAVRIAAALETDQGPLPSEVPDCNFSGDAMRSALVLGTAAMFALGAHAQTAQSE